MTSDKVFVPLKYRASFIA